MPKCRAALRAVLPAVLLAGCGSATPGPREQSRAQPPMPPGYPTEYPTPAPGPYTDADVRFMRDMIPHHEQAIVMAGWAPDRTERADVRILAARIAVAQQDEIRLAGNWLRERGEAVPARDPTHAADGSAHAVLMPGMLSDEELAQLEAARGAVFDSLFLTSMIRHHQGALTMVDQLFDSWGAAQDETVFRFASDVYADQLAEIERMTTMLEELQQR